jgi:Tol biopolymer transport system component
MNADGTGAVNLTQTPDHTELYPAWSPDGTRIVFSQVRDLNEDLYVMNSDGSAVIRLTEDATPEKSPVWSPDGSRILFVSEREGNFDLYVMGADGSNQIRLTDDPGVDASPAWSADGLRIAFTRGVLFTDTSSGTLWVMNADGTEQVQLPTSGEASGPAWRP